jgi:nitrogen fixation NifU-like protein
MPGLEDLYREIILDHYKSPRNRGALEPPAVRSEGHNPLCGDEIEVYIIVENGIVADIKISGQGCSISQSSASMMSAAVKGKPIEDIRALIHRFRHMMSIEEGDAPDDSLPLGDLEALQGVMKFPVRIKCAVLGWNTLAEALDIAAE